MVYFRQSGITLMRHAIMFNRCWTSCLDFGICVLLIALTFPGSGEIPFPDILFTKNISSVAPKTHLSLFTFKPDFWILFKNCSVWMSNWFRVSPHIMIFLSPHSPLLFLCCPVGKLYLHFVSSFDDSLSTFIWQ